MLNFSKHIIVFLLLFSACSVYATDPNLNYRFDKLNRNSPNVVIDSIEAIAGRVTLNNTKTNPEFTYVCFDTPFSEAPMVFSLPTTANDNHRLALRIRNVTTTGFEIAQVESSEDANPNAPAGNLPQTVDFLAIVKGDYTLSDGSKMRVSSLQTKKFQGRNFNNSSGNKGWQTISTADLNFTQKPAIIAAIQTMANEHNTNNSSSPFPVSDPFLATTITDVNNSAFKIALERGETNQGSISNDETIAYIVLKPGLSGQLTADVNFESFQTPQNLGGVGVCPIFNLTESNGSDNLHIIASQNTRRGPDGGWLKRCSISNQSVGFSIVEDMDGDSEGNHINEIAGGLALRGSFVDHTNSCAVIVDHYQISHDGNGLTCDPETIIVKACTNSYDGTCSESTEQLSLRVKATGKSGSVVNSITTNFIGNSNVSLPYLIAESTELSVDNASVSPVNPTVCINTGSTNTGAGTLDCSLVFSNAGFRFLSTNLPNNAIPNQIAGVAFKDTLRLQAVENNNGVCTGLFDGNVTVNLSQQNIPPNASSPGLSFQIDSLTPIPITIEKYPKYTPLTLNFNSNSMATIPDPLYNDAGQIRLYANYTDGTINLAGSTNAFWVRPDKLVATAKAGNTPLNANTAEISNSSPKHKAGEDFTLTVKAYNAASPAVVTPNYSPGQIQFELKRTGPVFSNSVNGDLTYDENSTLTAAIKPEPIKITLSDFSGGVFTYAKAKYSEVGLLNLDLRDNAYGDGTLVIEADSIDIGRFTPAYFKQTVHESGSLTATCYDTATLTEYFAYSGQMDQTNPNQVAQGTISYQFNPVLAITAYNAQGHITKLLSRNAGKQ
jgi:MSHA biogenesis protein MshQ